MTTRGEREEATAEVHDEPSRSDGVDASISAVEKALGLPPMGSLARKHDAIRKLGCSIVARALNIMK